MRPEVYLEQYRIRAAENEAPLEITRNGPAITYKAADLKSGAPVALTVVPIESVDPDERERFEEKARTAMLLDHVHIARTVAFGTADKSLVFVSEYPQGETVEEWVKANGPMPADAVLRMALQVVAALQAASFHGLNHPAIQPSNLIIVPGKTAEGGWPFVKLTHFALAGLKGAPGRDEPDVSASEFASPEQLLQGKVDFRSEIYSLGATMCFLLTGVFYSAYPRSPQTKRFVRPLRNLIARTLEDDAALRPQDPVVFSEELRSCLASIERRQTLQRKFGIPFAPIVAKPPRERRVRRRRPIPLFASIGRSPAPSPMEELATEDMLADEMAEPTRLRPAWAFAIALAALFAIAAGAAFFVPEDVITAAFHRKKPAADIGVPVGVPEGSSTNAAQNKTNTPPPVHQPSRSGETTIARSENSGSAPTPEENGSVPQSQPSSPPTPVLTHQSTARPAQPAIAANPPPAEKKDVPTKMAGESRSEAATTAASQDATVAPVATGTPVAVAANNAPAEPAPPSEAPDESARARRSNKPAHPTRDDTAANQSPAVSNSESQAESGKSDAAESENAQSHGKSPTVAQNRERSTKSRVPRSATASGTLRGRVVGITPNGNVILALPSGERAIVSPQDAEHYPQGQGSHRRPRRVIIERPAYDPQNPPYQPFLAPGD